eukprot:IDg6805t1
MRLEPVMAPLPSGNAAFLCLSTRYPRDFRFPPHGRASSNRRDINGQYGRNIRNSLLLTDRLSVLVDYLNEEPESCMQMGLRAMYSEMPPNWRGHFHYKYSGFYPPLSPAVTYLADKLDNYRANSNRASALVESEQLALIALEWHRQVYAHLKMWRLPAWCFQELAMMAPGLSTVLGNSWNTEYLSALLAKAQDLCLKSFDKETEATRV